MDGTGVPKEIRDDYKIYKGYENQFVQAVAAKIRQKAPETDWQGWVSSTPSKPLHIQDLFDSVQYIVDHEIGFNHTDFLVNIEK